MQKTEGSLAVGSTGVDNFTYTVTDGVATTQAQLHVTVTGSGVGNADANIFLLTASTSIAEGLAGDDTYYVDDAGDQIIEGSMGGSNDTVRSSVSYTLEAGVYVETLTTSDAASNTRINLTGNALSQNIIGNDGANIIDGKGGADTMRGLGGNDVYYVDNIGDVVDESVAGSTGVDTARSSVISVNLGDAVHFKGTIEQAAVDGNLALNATGNSLNNYLQGNSAANTLNGAIGADTMKGLGGNDTYIIDNAGDIVDEAATGSNGVDTIRSSVISVNLGDTAHFKGLIEQVALDGNLALNATGNGLNNYLQGNSAANTLNGLVGADTMKGLGGNDTYIVDNAGDRVDESAVGSSGVDTVRSSVMNVHLFDTAHYKGAIEQAAVDGTQALNVVGNSIDNYLEGNSAANGINGGLGNDTLKGNGGADRFYFNTALNAATNVDTINDFAIDDMIYLAKAVFSGITATGTLAATAFASNTTGLAGDASDRIIYETDTGKLFYDADGVGGTAGTLFAILPTGLALTNADFVVI